MIRATSICLYSHVTTVQFTAHYQYDLCKCDVTAWISACQNRGICNIIEGIRGSWLCHLVVDPIQRRSAWLRFLSFSHWPCTVESRYSGKSDGNFDQFRINTDWNIWDLENIRWDMARAERLSDFVLNFGFKGRSERASWTHLEEKKDAFV